MTEFNGTTKAFKRYLGPFLRGIVQQVTKRHKADIGACEHCGMNEALEAAHIHGRNRTDIINQLLGTSKADAAVQVNLEEFEAAFKREHEPVEKAILVLCKACHSNYDANVVRTGAVQAAGNTAEVLSVSSERSEDILPISLHPTHPDDFKARLLERREAVIEVYYENGAVERKPWIAHRFSENSNVLRNLRSRPEFRKGRWQEMGIVKVCVQVIE